MRLSDKRDARGISFLQDKKGSADPDKGACVHLFLFLCTEKRALRPDPVFFYKRERSMEL
jgi:hypothetical protein